MLCYAVLYNEESFISKNITHVTQFTKKNPTAICKVFDSIEEASHFISSSLETCIQKETAPLPVPTKSRPVVYFSFSFRKGINTCRILLKNPGKDATFLPPFEFSSLASKRVITEIKSILFVLDYLQDGFTVYTSSQDLVTIYNKQLPIWEKEKWSMPNPTAEYEEIRLLRQKIGSRVIHVKLCQSNDPLVELLEN